MNPTNGYRRLQVPVPAGRVAPTPSKSSFDHGNYYEEAEEDFEVEEDPPDEHDDDVENEDGIGRFSEGQARMNWNGPSATHSWDLGRKQRQLPPSRSMSDARSRSRGYEQHSAPSTSMRAAPSQRPQRLTPTPRPPLGPPPQEATTPREVPPPPSRSVAAVKPSGAPGVKAGLPRPPVAVRAVPPAWSRLAGTGSFGLAGSERRPAGDVKEEAAAEQSTKGAAISSDAKEDKDIDLLQQSAQERGKLKALCTDQSDEETDQASNKTPERLVPPHEKAPLVGEAVLSIVELNGLCDMRVIDLVDWPTFFEDMVTDVEKECNKFGEVTCAWADREAALGTVWLRFANAAEAKACFDNMSGRWFAGRKVQAQVHPVKVWKDLPVNATLGSS